MPDSSVGYAPREGKGMNLRVDFIETEYSNVCFRRSGALIGAPLPLRGSSRPGAS
jgi:hypothetical protein